jgi:cyanophycin synthetase
MTQNDERTLNEAGQVSSAAATRAAATESELLIPRATPIAEVLDARGTWNTADTAGEYEQQNAGASSIALMHTPMRVVDVGVYRGPHIYGHTPMIRLKVDLGELERWPSNRLPEFNDRLNALLPSLRKHGCSLHREGGFLERLRQGTWLGHIVEHVALELQSLAGSPVTRGKTRSVKGAPGTYNIMFAYQEEQVGLLAGRTALELVESLLPRSLRGIRGLHRVYGDERDVEHGDAFDLGSALDRMRRLLKRVALGPTTRSLVEEARRRGIPVMRLDDFSLVQLGYGKYQKRLRASVTGETRSIGVELAGDKDLAKSLLRECGVPVPQGTVVRSVEQAIRAARRLSGAVVIKPLDGNHGRGVSVGVAGDEQLARAFELAAQHSRRVIVEEKFTGHDHRILVVDGEVVAVAQRLPAQVTGDGAHTVAELIDAVNRDPRRGEGHESVMTRIEIDGHVMEQLAKADLTLDSVPLPGQTVCLRATANLSTGGTAIDRTDEIHPENAAIARRAALVLGLDVAGIDFIAPDISQSVRESGGGILEVNAAPGFRMHLEPSEGQPRNVARSVIRALFPEGAPRRVPLIAVTGTNGKSTTVRMVSHILRSTGLVVGMTSTSGIYINDERIVEGDASGPKSARTILRDPTVDVAVLETARGGILREGLAFAECDVGAVLNIAADHLGLKGIDTVEDLAWVKSVVVESVHENGCSVLNADDPHTFAMRRRAGGRLVFFSMKKKDDPELSHEVRDHIRQGGLAVLNETTANGAEIAVYMDGERRRLMNVAEIPATLGGLAGFNVQNALAAIAIACAQGVPLARIRAALSCFTCSYEHTPGRLNVFDGHGFRVIVDYAHNPAGLRALREVIVKMRPHHRRVICMVSIPGDRRDEDIMEMGEISAAFAHHLVFRERPDGRGRDAGEINELLTRGAIKAGFSPEAITCVADEFTATDLCLRSAQPGDLVVLTPTTYEEVWQQVLSFGSRAEPLPGAKLPADCRSPEHA